jgi:hypothetical protein
MWLMTAITNFIAMDWSGSDSHIHRNEKINFLNGRYGVAKFQ